ncbi:MAG: sulfurtransferase [Gammaproteobacteria bacterium]|nr:sulfurtransferase [Gammaproteobacteria bacterium]MDH5172676.1 sulfurtransferase [Gammaproteobacteria bacterium]
MLIEADQLLAEPPAVVFDCRFSLADAGAGHAQYLQGHIPGAHYLHLNRDLSGPVGGHGGRHPLPEPAVFAALLARHGVGPATRVVAYDDSRLAFASRLWWLLRSLGYRPPRLLNGGYQAWLAAGGRAETAVPSPLACEPAGPGQFGAWCDIEGLRALQGQGALLVDSREERRYLGLEEPIDPVAGHIPGAINRPWQGVTAADGRVLDHAGLRAHWGDALEAEQLVVYCGSGVTACVNLFSLALLGRHDATLYAGSWSDWCSYL